MTQIPGQPAVSAKDIQEWRQMKQRLQALQAAERLARERIYKALFTFKEGTTRLDLKTMAPELAGYDLIYEHGYDRKVDEPTLEAMKSTEVREVADQLKALGFQVDKMDPNAKLFAAIGVDPTKILRYKPELAVKAYKELTAEQRSIVDRFLEIKPSSAQLKVELNKEGKAAAETAAAPQAPAYPAQVPPPPAVDVPPPGHAVHTQPTPVVPPPPLDIPVFVPRDNGKPPF